MYYYIMKKRKLLERGFRRSSYLQAAWDTCNERTTGIMLPHQEC